MNRLLISALRQYQHNDCSDLLSAYDAEETEKVVNALQRKIERLEKVLIKIYEEPSNTDQIIDITYTALNGNV